MKLITAIYVLFSNDPAISDRLEEAVKTMRMEEIRSDSHLSQECVKALRNLKQKTKAFKKARASSHKINDCYRAEGH